MMAAAKGRMQVEYSVNLQHKRSFEFVTELRLDECIARLGGKNEQEVERLIPRQNLMLTVKPLQPGQLFEFSLHSTIQNLEVCGAGSLEKMSDDRTLVRGEARLNRMTAVLLTFFTLIIGVGMAGIVFLLFPPAGVLPVLLMYSMWKIALKTRNSLVDYVTGTLLLEKPKQISTVAFDRV